MSLRKNWQALRAALAGLLGVQSYRQQARDFGAGEGWRYLLVALITCAVFLLTVIGLVRLALYLGGV